MSSIIPSIDILQRIAVFLSVKELAALARVCKKLCQDFRRLLDMPAFSESKIEYVLGCLASKRVWKRREWMDLTQVGRAYDSIYDTFPLEYDLSEFMKERPEVFGLESKSHYRDRFWNIQLFGDPDK